MKRLFLIILFLSAVLMTKAAYSKHTLNTHLELKPVPASFKIAKSHFLPEYQAGDFKFEGGGDIADACPTSIYQYTKDNCTYPNTPRQPCGGRYRVCDCASPYVSSEQCAAQGKEGGGQICTVKGGSRNGTVYYSACVCPSSYIKLATGQNCTGKTCSYGGEKYCENPDYIECNDNYKICGQNQSGKGEQCTAKGQTKYTECSCDTTLYPQTAETCKADFGENAILSGSICGDNERGTSCSCEAGCPASHPDKSCGSLGAADEIDDGCGGKCFKCNSCSPTCTDETNCPNGTETVANGCGGTCTVCKKGPPAEAVIFTFSPDTANVTLTLPTASYSGTANYNVDWGDGTVDKNLTTFSPTHTYAKAGNYDVTITGSLGKLEQISSSNIKYVTQIKQLNLGSIKRFYNTFRGGKNIIGTIPELPAGLTGGSLMFSGCIGLTGNIPELPTGLTDGRGMFSSCRGLTGNIPELPAGLTDGSYMFYDCSGLSGVTPVNGQYPYQYLSNITNTEFMVWGCSEAVSQHFPTSWSGSCTSCN